MSADIYDQFLHGMPLSERIEEGGFLLGRIQPASDPPGRTRARHARDAGCPAGASAVHFTFTPDSFTEVNQLLAERSRGEELVGWYHTHLFPVTADMGTETGLSSIDIETHFATFRRPWQVAGLINLPVRAGCCGSSAKVKDEMRECRGIGDERGRYRVAGAALGAR